MDQLNTLSPNELGTLLCGCCGSRQWCQSMATMRPFVDVADLHAKADAAFEQLDEADWLESFACHPQIGDLESLKMKFAGNDRWSSGEQSGISAADEQTLIELAEGNRQYVDRFGYIFIVCASGKTADEMLQLLRSRLAHAPDEELSFAAEQQRQITHLRIDKLLTDQEPTP